MISYHLRFLIYWLTNKVLIFFFNESKNEMKETKILIFYNIFLCVFLFWLDHSEFTILFKTLKKTEDNKIRTRNDKPTHY